MTKLFPPCSYFSIHIGEANKCLEAGIWPFLFGFQFAGSHGGCLPVNTYIGLEIEVMARREKVAKEAEGIRVNLESPHLLPVPCSAHLSRTLEPEKLFKPFNQGH
jgi:hypothetical protein